MPFTNTMHIKILFSYLYHQYIAFSTFFTAQNRYCGLFCLNANLDSIKSDFLLRNGHFIKVGYFIYVNIILYCLTWPDF